MSCEKHQIPRPSMTVWDFHVFRCIWHNFWWPAQDPASLLPKVRNHTLLSRTPHHLLFFWVCPKYAVNAFFQHSGSECKCGWIVAGAEERDHQGWWEPDGDADAGAAMGPPLSPRLHSRTTEPSMLCVASDGKQVWSSLMVLEGAGTQSNTFTYRHDQRLTQLHSNKQPDKNRGGDV